MFFIYKTKNTGIHRYIKLSLKPKLKNDVTLILKSSAGLIIRKKFRVKQFIFVQPNLKGNVISKMSNNLVNLFLMNAIFIMKQHVKPNM